MAKINLEFPVSIYGLKKYNDVVSIARCRMFYKYENRNGTYITDEFAEKLLSTIQYVPIKGIYDEEAQDFTDHGEARNLGHAYGIVAHEPNIQWEKHVDEDGIEREYACADVILFTALYEEANKIVGKAQSMELYAPSLKYHRESRHGQIYVVFDDGCFLGLQVLGDDVEPCFEGAAFYSLQESVQNVINKIEELSKNYSTGGQIEMPGNTEFRLSDEAKYCALSALLNADYEGDGWYQQYCIIDVYDDYAIAFNRVEQIYERVYYTKDDSNDSVVINKKQRCYIVDVSEEEKTTLDTLRTLNGGTYECVADVLTSAADNAIEVATLRTSAADAQSQIEALTAQNFELNQNLESKISEYEGIISTLNTEKAELTDKFTASENSVTTLNSELDELKNYKYNVERKAKEDVLGNYESQLAAETIEAYRSKLDEYTILDLDMRLTYELKKANPAVFNAQPDSGYLPKDAPVGGIEEILKKYRK